MTDPVDDILDAMSALFERPVKPPPTMVLTDREYDACLADLEAMGIEPTHANLEATAAQIVGECKIERMDPLT